MTQKNSIDNREDIQLIWFDETNDFDPIKAMMYKINSFVKFYSDFDQYFDLIKLIDNARIILIISKDSADKILSKTQYYHMKIVKIFMFSFNEKHNHSNFIDDQSLILYFNNQNDLFETIHKYIHLIENDIMTFTFCDQEQTSYDNLSKISAKFILHQILISVLQELPENDQSKHEILDLCRYYYENDEIQLKNIEEFQQNYSSNDAIRWYKSKYFTYKLLNKALRTNDVELIFNFRFFLIDLYKQIQQNYENIENSSHFIFYRLTQISIEDFDQLRENTSKILSINGFFKASQINIVSKDIGKINRKFLLNNYHHVLFEIHIDQSSKTNSFANIINDNCVIFNIYSQFQINSIDFDLKYQIWKIQLQTIDQDSTYVERYLTKSRIELKEYSLLINFGYLLLYVFDNIEHADLYFNKLLKFISYEHCDVASIYNNIGNIYNQKGELDLALKNFQISYEIRQKDLSPDHLHIIMSLNNIGMIYKAKADYDIALDYFQKALKILENINEKYDLQSSIIHENIGKVYADKNDYENSFLYLFRAIELLKQNESERISDIARCFGTIGYIYETTDDLQLALNYYDKQLSLEEEFLPFDHPYLINHLQWIVDIYVKLNCINEALKLCETKIEIWKKNSIDKNFVSMAQIYVLMANIIHYYRPDEALNYCNRALSILDNVRISDQQAIIDCLNLMPCLSVEYDDMCLNLIQYELKILNILRRILPSYHVNIGNHLRMMGLHCEEMNKQTVALDYFTESLLLYEKNYGRDHSNVEDLEKDIQRIRIESLTSDLVNDKYNKSTLNSSTNTNQKDDENIINNSNTNFNSKTCTIL